ncbi:MAG: dimethylarginine dimethylaminohydrolase family protein [Eubacteriales bacterium]
MATNPTARFAIVRGVPATYDKCIKPNGQDNRIDVDLAKEQHEKYCLALQELGLTLLRVDPDDSLPDCCFVEDTATVAGETAVITRMGTPSRALETAAVKKVISGYLNTAEILPPAVIDGGDVLKIKKDIYIGLSGRTDRHAVEQVEALVSAGGCRVIPVEISGALHLKTTCTYLGNGCVVLAPGHFDPKKLSGYSIIAVPGNEAYSANCLAVNGRVLIPKGYPLTRELIEKEGFKTVEVDISEFRKGNGGLTCLSILFEV